MLALFLMLLGTYYTLPIMLALCLMLLGTYYAQNYAGIIGRCLNICTKINNSKMLSFTIKDVIDACNCIIYAEPKYINSLWLLM